MRSFGVLRPYVMIIEILRKKGFSKTVPTTPLNNL